MIGVQDCSLHIVGVQQLHDYTPEKHSPAFAGALLQSELGRFFCIESFTTSDTGKTVWVFHIPKHRPRLPVYAHDKAWQRLDDALTEMRQERLEAILNEPIDIQDWSAQTVLGATHADLDEQAVDVARQKFAEKHRNASFAEDIQTWDLATFSGQSEADYSGMHHALRFVVGGQTRSQSFSANPGTNHLETRR